MQKQHNLARKQANTIRWIVTYISVDSSTLLPKKHHLKIVPFATSPGAASDLHNFHIPYLDL